ncbi:MAG: hypothetical protein KY460_13440 [Actinobacteria bacterium]|nr:hypothetical protein [Actinomycetota bacterium]
MSLVGARVLRKEDPNLLTGRGQFVDDIALPGTLFMTLVHSTEAHARIAGIDTSTARDMPGVRGVWTLGDLGDVPPLPGVPGFDRPVLAGDRVRFVGEPVAVIVADDRYAAAAAVEGGVVDYEPLPPLVTTDPALADDATPLFDLRVPRHTGVGFQKFRRRAQDWAIVGAVATRTNGATVVGYRRHLARVLTHRALQQLAG